MSNLFQLFELSLNTTANLSVKSNANAKKDQDKQEFSELFQTQGDFNNLEDINKFIFDPGDDATLQGDRGDLSSLPKKLPQEGNLFPHEPLVDVLPSSDEDIIHSLDKKVPLSNLVVGNVTDKSIKEDDKVKLLEESVTDSPSPLGETHKRSPIDSEAIVRIDNPITINNDNQLEVKKDNLSRPKSETTLSNNLNIEKEVPIINNKEPLQKEGVKVDLIKTKNSTFHSKNLNGELSFNKEANFNKEVDRNVTDLTQKKIEIGNLLNGDKLSENKGFEDKNLESKSLESKNLESEILEGRTLEDKSLKDKSFDNLRRDLFVSIKDESNNLNKLAINKPLELPSAKQNIINEETYLKSPIITQDVINIQEDKESSINDVMLLKVAQESLDKKILEPVLKSTTQSEFGENLKAKQNFAPDLSLRIQWMFKQALSSAEIMMEPAELGPLNVKVQQHNGETNIIFQVSNTATRELLNENLPKLREMLEQQSIHLGDASVEDQTSQSNNNEEDNLVTTSEKEADAIDDTTEIELQTSVPHSNHLLDIYS